MSVVVGAGSANETMATAGMAATLEQTAFCSTENQTAFKILRDAEAASVTLSAKAGRKSVSYNATFPRGDVEAVATLAECVTSPALHSWEVSRYGAMAGRVAPSAAEGRSLSLCPPCRHMSSSGANMWLQSRPCGRLCGENHPGDGSPGSRLLAVCPSVARSPLAHWESAALLVAAVADLYSAAFHNTAGRAPTVPAARVGKVSSDDVASYRAQHFSGANTVVVGVDIPHEELVAAVSVSACAVRPGPAVGWTTGWGRYLGPTRAIPP